MKRIVSILFWIMVGFSNFYCTPTSQKIYDESEMEALVKRSLPSMSVISSSSIIEEECKAAYQLNDYHLIWLKPDEMSPALSRYFVKILNLQDEGVDIANFNVRAFRSLKANFDSIYSHNKKVPEDSLFYYDFLLTQNYITAAYLLQYGNLNKLSAIDSIAQFERLDVANNLVYAINNDDQFPSLAVFRPQHPLYTQMVLAIKDWMLLNADTAYLNAKNILSTQKQDLQPAIFKILTKEIGSIEHYNNDTSLLIKAYQTARGLATTGILDTNTLQELGKKPERYRHQLKVNMERLRQMPNINFEAALWYNLGDRKLSYFNENKSICLGQVVSSAPKDKGAILTTPLGRNDTLYRKQYPRSEYIVVPHASSAILEVYQNNGKQQLIDVLKVVNPKEFHSLIAQLKADNILDPTTDTAIAPLVLYKNYFTVCIDAQNGRINYLPDVLKLDGAVKVF